MVKECQFGPIKYVSFDERTNKYYTRYTIRTISNLSFYHLRNKWYPRGIKIVPPDVVLTPTTMLFWYVGDGGLINGPRSQYIKLSTYSFSSKDINILMDKLSEYQPKKYGKKQYVIYIPRIQIKKFLDYIGDCVMICYKHKWHFKEYKYERYVRRQNEIKL